MGRSYLKITIIIFVVALILTSSHAFNGKPFWKKALNLFGFGDHHNNKVPDHVTRNKNEENDQDDDFLGYDDLLDDYYLEGNNLGNNHNEL
jgi:hypothetical protein